MKGPERGSSKKVGYKGFLGEKGKAGLPEVRGVCSRRRYQTRGSSVRRAEVRPPSVGILV